MAWRAKGCGVACQGGVPQMVAVMSMPASTIGPSSGLPCSPPRTRKKNPTKTGKPSAIGQLRAVYDTRLLGKLAAHLGGAGSQPGMHRVVAWCAQGRSLGRAGAQAHLLDDVCGALAHRLAAEASEDEDEHPAH
eukprot:scaffold6506_cov34-Phaeocystis_antarctica.AAC.2